MARVPLALHSYQHATLPLSAQRVCNLYFEEAPGESRFAGILIGTPGADRFVRVGPGPIRGMAEFMDRLCVVSGNEFYTIASDGTAIMQGLVTDGDDVVQMEANPTQLAILSGPGSGPFSDLYYWDGTDLNQVMPGAYPGGSFMAYQDGYHIVVKPDSEQFYISGLLNVATWDALDFASAEGHPDKLVAIVSNNRDLWLFGETSTEIWYNAGAADFPFLRNQAGFVERGCIAKNTAVRAENSVLWLGDNLVFYRSNGYLPFRVSTYAIEEKIRKYANPEKAVSFVYEEAGHIFYVTSFDEATWVYDLSSQLWHERQSYGMDRWRMNGHAKAFGKNYMADYLDGNIYEVSLDRYLENGAEMTREATSPPIHAQGLMQSFGEVEFELNTGVGLVEGLGSDPQLMLDWSDDGGRTWSNQLFRPFGKIGEYGKRVTFNRLGQARFRVFRVRISDPVPVGLIAFTPDGYQSA